MTLPRGVTKQVRDSGRIRYRVRLYLNNKVCYLKYVHTEEEALQRYHEALEQRDERRANPPNSVDRTTVSGHLKALLGEPTQ